MMYFEIDDFQMLREALHEFEKRLSSEHILEDTIFLGKLVADELLSNVLQHGGGRAYFTASLEKDELVLSVRSDIAFRPPEKSTLADEFAESGRGLYLVDCLCSRREYSETEGIKVFLKLENPPAL